MPEQFSLEWNNQQSAWRESLTELRSIDDFADVTLVTEDKMKFSAHKILLSSCSNTLKFILKDNIHPKPLLYMSGINSKNLGLILDYIYCGEVKLFQEQLNGFLESAKKLEIKGLEAVNHDKTSLDELEQDNVKFDDFTIEEPSTEEEEIKFESSTPSHRRRNSQGPSYHPGFNASMSQEEFAIKRRALYQKVNGEWDCMACDYNTNDKSNIRKHVEKHIEGLSYACKFCNREFRTRSNLYSHMNHCTKFKSNKK